MNQITIGWINYYRIANMKMFIKEYGEWLRHKVRVVIIKRWKKPPTIYKNLMKINQACGYNFSEQQIYGIANARQGLYRMCKHPTINFILNPTIISKENKKENRPGLVNPLSHYLSKS